VYLVNFFVLLIGQQCLIDFPATCARFPHWQEEFANCTPTFKKIWPIPSEVLSVGQ